MIHRSRVVLLAFVLATSMGEPTAFAATDVLAPPKIQKVRLTGGLEVLLAPDPNAVAADVAIWYRVGSLQAPPGQSGISYLLQRIVFRSVADSAHDYRRLLGAEGAVANTMTTPDFTTLYATVPPDAVELAIRLEAARMRDFEPSERSFETEHAFIQKERRAFLESNPIGSGLEQLFAAAYPKHGYGLPVPGSESDLAGITLEQVRAFHDAHYLPERALLTVTGRFDAQAALAAIRSAFDSVPRSTRAAPKPTPSDLPSPQRRAEGSLDGRFSILLAGWRVPAGARSLAATELMVDILGDPIDGRLTRGLVGPDRPFLQVRSGLDARHLGSLFYVYAILGPGADLASAESTLLDSVAALARRPVAEAELAKARARSELSVRSELQTARGQARALGIGTLIDGDPTALWKRLQQQRSLTPASLHGAARELLGEDRRSVVVLTGTEADHDAKDQP